MKIDEPKTKQKVNAYTDTYNEGKELSEMIRGGVVGTLDKLVQWFCEYTINYNLDLKLLPVLPERGRFYIIPISKGLVDAKSFAKRFNLSKDSGHRTIQAHLEKLRNAGIIDYLRSERKARKGQITKDYSLTIGINANLVVMRE